MCAIQNSLFIGFTRTSHGKWDTPSWMEMIHRPRGRDDVCISYPGVPQTTLFDYWCFLLSVNWQMPKNRTRTLHPPKIWGSFLHLYYFWTKLAYRIQSFLSYIGLKHLHHKTGITKYQSCESIDSSKAFTFCFL